jgi:hypothetical protein
MADHDEDPLEHADRDALVPAEPVETDEGWVVPRTQNVGDADQR